MWTCRWTQALRRNIQPPPSWQQGSTFYFFPLKKSPPVSLIWAPVSYFPEKWTTAFLKTRVLGVHVTCLFWARPPWLLLFGVAHDQTSEAQQQPEASPVSYTTHTSVILKDNIRAFDWVHRKATGWSRYFNTLTMICSAKKQLLFLFFERRSRSICSAVLKGKVPDYSTKSTALS
jgi:hypothetical protein